MKDTPNALRNVTDLASRLNYVVPRDKKNSHKIEQRRSRIHRHMIKKYGKKMAMFTELSKRHVKTLYRLYNRIVFDGLLKRELRKRGRSLKLRVTQGSSNASAGGWCKRQANGHIISFPASLYTGLFGTAGACIKNAGLIATDRLRALQLTMEHELAHLVIQLLDSPRRNTGSKTYLY
jgi:hypothetical protein